MGVGKRIESKGVREQAKSEIEFYAEGAEITEFPEKTENGESGGRPFDTQGRRDGAGGKAVASHRTP